MKHKKADLMVMWWSGFLAYEKHTRKTGNNLNSGHYLQMTRAAKNHSDRNQELDKQINEISWMIKEAEGLECYIPSEE